MVLGEKGAQQRLGPRCIAVILDKKRARLLRIGRFGG
jgi:hypothetical protein